jgi:hypothetical protein
MPPAFFVPNTARHCHRALAPSPAILPLPFPLYSLLSTLCLCIHSRCTAVLSRGLATPPFHGPIAADLAKVI